MIHFYQAKTSPQADSTGVNYIAIRVKQNGKPFSGRCENSWWQARPRLTFGKLIRYMV